MVVLKDGLIGKGLLNQMRRQGGCSLEVQEMRLIDGPLIHCSLGVIETMNLTVSCLINWLRQLRQPIALIVGVFSCASRGRSSERPCFELFFSLMLSGLRV